jgi:hypothetical protein
MPWFKALLTYPQLAGDEPQALRKKFSDIWVDSGSPKEMALFCETDPTDEGLSVYFSPRSLPMAESLISSYSGTPCKRPKKELAMLVGHSDALKLLR